MHMSEARKRPQLSLRELYQVNWFLGILLALLAICTAVYLEGYGVHLHLLLTIGLITIGFIRPQITSYVPRIFWQGVPFILVILLAIDLHLSIEPVPALMRLNILLILYRSLAFRRKREDLQLIVLCLFLIIIVGVVTVALTFIVQILLFTAVAMAFLFNITLMDEGREEINPRDVWRDFTWRRFIRKLWALWDAGSVVVAGITFGSVVFFSVLLFLLIPRFDVNNPIPFFGMGRTSQTGFSESIRFGDVTDIRNNDRVALRVEVASDERIPVEPYWRMLVLDDYRDGGFQVSRAVMSNVRSEAKLSHVLYRHWLIGAEEPPQASNTWTFYLEGGVARYLPLTGRFERIRFQEARNLNYLTPFHVFGLSRVNSGMLVYQVENMEFSGRFSDPNFGHYSLDYAFYPEIDFFFDHDYVNYPDTTLALHLSRSDRDYLREVVQEIKQGRDDLSHEEFAALASNWLQRRHAYSMSYSLQPGPEDHVVRWLRSRQPGHCEVFSAALILLCRTEGIPARAVTGFKGGSWNTFENYFMVRYADAHAWVEVFDGNGSWVRFDPTPGSLETPVTTVAEMSMGATALDSSFAAYLDSLRILWYRRIVSFDQTSQFQLWTAFVDTWGRVDPRRWLAQAKDFVTAWMSAPWNSKRFAEVLGLFGAGGLFCFLVAFCIRRDRMSLFTFGRRGGDPVRRRAGTYLRRLRGMIGSRDFPQPVEDELQALFQDLQRLRFGPASARTVCDSVFRRARRQMRQLR
jgi:protein-glutamine gamma-glutamyltransferase